MKNFLSITALALLVASVSAPIANAQSGGAYDLSWNTMDDGGGTGSGGIYSVSGTTGQPDAGTLSGGIYLLAGGFWGAGTSAPLLSYASWIAGFGLSGAAAAAGADPDGDGLPNGAEYILGGIPNVSGAPARPAATASGGNMVFTFSRSDASETPDVSLTVQSGPDLLTWTGGYTIGPDTASSSSGVVVTENGAAADTITVTIPRGTVKRLFARMKVTITL